MKVLCFGGSGFIGQYVVKELIAQKHEVINADIDTFVNIKRSKEVNSVIFSINPDIIYNFAGVSDIGQCSKYPDLAFETNIIGNHNVLNSISELSKKIKYIYSSSLYAENVSSGMYAITKKTSEDLIKFYSKRFNFPYIIARLGSVYGPGSSRENGVYRLVEKALKDNLVEYYGDGTEIRSHIYVEDLARALVEMINEKYDNSTWIFKGVESIKSKDLCEMIAEILNIKNIEYRCEKPVDHYKVSPYRYEKNLAKVYNLPFSTDFGEGILRVIEDLNK